eukprot:544804-Pelagomonas_calceolata.AAC.1
MLLASAQGPAGRGGAEALSKVLRQPVCRHCCACCMILKEHDHVHGTFTHVLCVTGCPFVTRRRPQWH